MKIAITGSIACGKSTFATLLQERGFEVCEADLLAHEAMDRGKPVYDEIVSKFGSGILDVEGDIDRKKMADRVFSNPEELEELNAMVHPRVIREWTAWLESRDPACRGAVVVVPLLYEAGVTSGWDAVICVVCSEHEQLNRLRERGLGEEDALLRIHSQLPQQEKAIRADYVVVNNSSIDMLAKQADLVLNNISKQD